MKAVTLLFDRSLYDERALRDAAEAFGSFAKIIVGRKDGHFTLSIASFDDKGEIVVGEIRNFVLARTVELRAK